MAYFKIQTSGLVTLGIESIDNTWASNGRPKIQISGQLIPEHIKVQQLLAPTGLMITSTEVEDIFNNYNSTSYEHSYIESATQEGSGCYYFEFPGGGGGADGLTRLSSSAASTGVSSPGANQP